VTLLLPTRRAVVVSDFHARGGITAQVRAEYPYVEPGAASAEFPGRESAPAR